MELKPGSRWRSAVCDVEVVVVKPPKSAVTLECGGLPMALPASAIQAAAKTGTPLSLTGKRYADEQSGIELLCVKAGPSSLSVDGRPLTIREARRLPSSD